MEENNIPKTGLSDEKLLEAKKEVEAVLAKHNIILVPIVIHHGDRTISRIDIAPAPEASEASE
jgi:hypothetical protein